MRMFIMLALRLSAGPENLARIRGVLQSGQLPHVDRRDEAGNNVPLGRPAGVDHRPGGRPGARSGRRRAR